MGHEGPMPQAVLTRSSYRDVSRTLGILDFLSFFLSFFLSYFLIVILCTPVAVVLSPLT